jgi:ADP-heptose:LPS heptosyltransferase
MIPLAAIRSSRCDRLLVRGVNWLGDAVMSTPALLRLREALPDTHISLLTPEKLADLWVQHPAVDAVVMFTEQDTAWSVGRQLRQQEFNVGLVLPNSPRSALELWLAGIPVRIGYAAAWRRWFLTHPLPPRPGAVRMRKRGSAEVKRLVCSHPECHQPSTINHPLASAAHHLHHYMHLAAALGANPAPLAPMVSISQRESRSVAERFGFGPAGPDLAPLFGLHAGAQYGPAKRWPADRFAAAAVELRRRTGCCWVIFGGPAETGLASTIATEITRHVPGRQPLAGTAPRPAPVSNLAGRTTLRELAAALKACRVLLANDTGPMHLAAAVGTPVVVPFGSTSPELTGPGLPGDSRHRVLRANVPCSPCFLRQCPVDLRCLTGVSVDQVVQAVLEVVEPRR